MECQSLNFRQRMDSKLISSLGANCTPGRQRDDDLIDFSISGVSLWEALMQQEKSRGRLKPNSSLPHLKGIFRCVLARYIDVFRTGYSNRQIAEHRNLAPVATCECGEPGCGGVWTRVFVGREKVYWAGFTFWNMGPQLPGPFYDGRLRVFDLPQYNKQLTKLIYGIDP